MNYCKKCGRTINDGETVCSNCGASVTETGGSKTSMIVVLILTIILAISPFIKMYYTDFFYQEKFSAAGTFATLGAMFGAGASLSESFRLSDIDWSSMSEAGKFALGVVGFDILMFLMGFVEMLNAAVSMNKSELKFWKSAYSSALAYFMGHLIIFLIIVIVNLVIAGEFGIEASALFTVMGARVIHFVIQLLAIITWAVAHGQYRQCKKAQS